MLRFFLLLNQHKTGRVIINTLGNYANTAFTVIFVLLLTRLMGRSEYGELSVLLGISYVLANILEFGSTASIYSVVPDLYSATNRHALAQFIKSTFWFLSIAAISVVCILIIIFPLLDRVFFKTGVDEYILTLTAISVLLYVWQNMVTNMLFAVGRFLSANVWSIVANIVKTIVVFVLYAFGILNMGSVIAVFGILGPLVFFALVAVAHPHLTRQIWHTKPARSDIRMRYTMANFVAQQFFNIGIRMDLFLLSYFGLKELVGDYGIAQKIILTVIGTVVSVTQVLSPVYALIRSKEDFRRELHHSLRYLILPTSLFLVLTFLPPSVFELVFTKKYAEVPQLTHQMGVAYSLFAMGQICTLFLLYTFRKPLYLIVANFCFFVTLTGFCLVMIPRIGAYAGPIGLGISFFIVTAVQIFGVWREYIKLPDV